MKTIYVIFSSTDLKTGRMIRAVTRNEYNHCSVCLSGDLSKFYSFSRIYLGAPFLGGFTVESPCRYTLSSRTKLKIVAVPVDDEGFEAVRKMIRNMDEHGEEYVYNFFSAAAYIFGKKFTRENAFTCAEFTARVLKTAGVDMPKMANIGQMEAALSNFPTWEGRAVDGLFGSSWGDDKYLEPIGRLESAVQTCRRLKRLVVGRV